jgi:hypothetical protein
MDWFLLSNVGSFKNFKDLAHENLNSIETQSQESQSIHNANDVEFVEVSRTKRPNTVLCQSPLHDPRTPAVPWDGRKTPRVAYRAPTATAPRKTNDGGGGDVESGTGIQLLRSLGNGQGTV